MRLLLSCALLMMSLTAHGSMPGAAVEQQGPMASDSLVPSGMDTQAYLAKVDNLLAMAANGTYGNLRRGGPRDLQNARDTMAKVLGTRTTLDNLPNEDLLALQNAEDTIGAILRHNEKDRMVCKRATKTGTRFATTECMTVAQREARAASAAETTGFVQREYCTPTDETPCSN